jgi:tetratricopeptide (TPR) repeat protein/predicted translin family RNA/ssDNA-binding protein
VNNPLHQNRWSPIADYALLLGSGAGAVASIATQNIAAATVPMTALVAMGLLNRRRLDRYFQQTQESLAGIEGQFFTEVSILSEQVSALPTPEAIHDLQRSTMEHSDRTLVHVAETVAQAKRDLYQRLEQLESPDLSHLHQDMTELQDQYRDMCTSLSTLSKQVERLSHQPRMEETETEISQLKTEIMQLRVNLETLGGESKNAQATLQDAIRHLDRRLRQLPNSADPNLLKGEVRELVKAVSELVPRRDFATLSEKVKSMQDSQESLQQTLDRLRSSPTTTALTEAVAAAPHDDLLALQAELLQLGESLQTVEARLDDMAVPVDMTAEIRGTTATYLNGIQWQLAMLEEQTQTLMQQQRTLSGLPSQRTTGSWLSAPESPKASTLPPPQWLMALRGDADDEPWSGVDQAFFQALDEASERLVMVWPWSSVIPLDDRLIERFRDLLENGCRVEIGWCHAGDRHEGRLLKAINRQWQLTSGQRRLLKSTLNQLLPLKQQYSDLFSFKILGTQEQFLVCDHRYAIVGLDALSVASSTFPHLDVRIKTAESGIIHQLLHRFDNPDTLPEDAIAYFNRAITRYDLRDTEGAIADFAEVLRLNPADAVTLNNRSLIWAEKKQHQRAIEDLNHALSLDAHLFAAHCNRGWLLMNQGKTEAAIADFDQAIQADPNSAIPYFYRGTARQRAGDSLGAIADFTQAIHKNDQIALPYCYRGAAYQRQGDIIRAISDLETAASLLHAQGDHQALAQVTTVLASLKEPNISQPIKLRSA